MFFLVFIVVLRNGLIYGLKVFFSNFLIVWNRTESKETAPIPEFYRKAEKIQPDQGRRICHGPGEGHLDLCGGELTVLARGAERNK